MTFFIRDNKRNNFVDIELYNKEDYLEISCAIGIPEYSKLLLSLDAAQQEQCIEDFRFLSEIRAWFWEQYVETNNVTHKQTIEDITKILWDIAQRYGLFVVTD